MDEEAAYLFEDSTGETTHLAEGQIRQFLRAGDLQWKINPKEPGRGWRLWPADWDALVKVRQIQSEIDGQPAFGWEWLEQNLGQPMSKQTGSR